MAVGPTLTEPTHDISLSDGVTTLNLIVTDSNGKANPKAIKAVPFPRTAMKTAQGSTKYSDLEPPFFVIAQEDWSGGRGGGEFDENSSMYYDAEGANTQHSGKIFPNPRPQFCTGYGETFDQVMGTGKGWVDLNSVGYKALQFTASASYTTAYIQFYGKNTGTGSLSPTISIYSNNAGVPGTALETANITVGHGLHTISIGEALTSGTVYWLVFYSGAQATSTRYFSILAGTSGTAKSSVNGTEWADGTSYFDYRILPALSESDAIFFEFKGSEHVVRNPVAGTAGKIYINGDQGAATGGAATTLTDSAKTWTNDEWIGCVVKLNAGTGSSAEDNYRTITDNDGTSLTVSPAWTINPGANTEYSIIKSSKWTDITSAVAGEYPAGTVTDVLVVNQCVYLAQGESTDILRLRAYNNGGTWTRQWAADTNNKATLLKAVTASDGTLNIWKANLPNSLAKAPALDGSGTGAVAALTFATAVTAGSSSTKITGLEEYGDPMTLWVMKEDMVYYYEKAIDKDTFQPIQLKEMQSGSAESNGRAHCVQGVYLYFNYGKSLERYYNSQLDDINPNRGIGLPTTRRGTINKLLSAPGRVYFSIVPTAQSTGYASLMVWDGVGFHEYYRAPLGRRIFDFGIQTLPGATLDRMWVAVGSDIIFLDHSMNPLDETGYVFSPTFTLTTSYFTAGMPEINKFFKSLSIGFSTAGNVVVAYYIGRSVGSRGKMTNVFNSLPAEEADFVTSTKGLDIQLELLYEVSSGVTSAPVITKTALKALASQPVKYSYRFLTRISDENIDKEGDEDTSTRVETTIAQLNTWMSNATPLTMRCLFSPFDNKTVWLEPPTYDPYAINPDEQTEGIVAEITLLEA